MMTFCGTTLRSGALYKSRAAGDAFANLQVSRRSVDHLKRFCISHFGYSGWAVMGRITGCRDWWRFGAALSLCILLLSTATVRGDEEKIDAGKGSYTYSVDI